MISDTKPPESISSIEGTSADEDSDFQQYEQIEHIPHESDFTQSR